MLRGLRIAAGGALIAYAVAAIVLPRSGMSPTTYAAASVTNHAADLAAGLALLGAGVLVAVDPLRRRLGVLAILAGVAWFGPNWEGWSNGPVFVRSLGALAPPLFLALITHLVLAFPTGELGSRHKRAAIAAVYALAAVVTVGRALFRDPILDAYCWRNCIANSFLVRSDAGLTRTIDELWAPGLLALGAALVLLAVWRLVAVSGAARRRLWPVAVSGGLVGAAAAAYAVALWRDRLEDPERALYASLFLALACSVVAFALSIAWHAVEMRRTRASLGRLAQELRDAPEPGGLRDALAGSLADPTLVVLYWSSSRGRFVDEAGKDAVLPAAGDGRAVTPITRDGAPIAAVVHDAGLLDLPDLGHEIGSAARLAVENERLEVELRARLEAVRASRERIVEAGDDERRRLERNLHDGVQQRLLGLCYQLRLAHADAVAGRNVELAALLAEGGAEAQSALDELRRLAQGIYPAVLTAAGLEAALSGLADTAELPVELTATAERYPAAVERAAYVAVAELIDDAAGREASFVRIELGAQADRLVVSAHDDGRPRGGDLVYASDRVGALGGSLDLAPTEARAEIPCA